MSCNAFHDLSAQYFPNPIPSWRLESATWATVGAVGNKREIINCSGELVVHLKSRVGLQLELKDLKHVEECAFVLPHSLALFWTF